MGDNGSKISDIIPTIGLVGPLTASITAFERSNHATPDFEVVQDSEAGRFSMGLTSWVGQLES
jgi:hypothetical protein